MLARLLLLAFPIHVICRNVSKTRGVAPESQSLYTPSSSSPQTWKCLDDPQVILWTAVNDDYCDCADGSDEPGTSACPDASFYCLNKGHKGSRIASSRVDDGLCVLEEPECCDGSDEPLGICPNVCEQVGKAYAQKMEAELKLRKTGSKIRSTYIAFALKEKKRLEDSIASLTREVTVREKEVARLKDIMERTESLSAATLEFKKQSPLYQSLLTHHNALKSLHKVHLKHLERENQLGDILEALKGGYNPNYQDMAVLEAVRGWEALSGEKKDSADSTNEPELEGEWTEIELEHQLQDVINQDHLALLLGHESHLNQASTSLLFDLSSYIPDSFVPHYNQLRDTAVGWLRTLGILRGTTIADADETSQARTAYNDAESKYTSAKEEKHDHTEELAELFDPEGFGMEGEWKKLQGLCLSKDTGEYTYEVCLFGDATQKSGAHHSLGKFSSWSTDPDVKPGEPRYYQTQHYTRGAKCWNGPERSVTLHLSCGTENKILTIAEPEKCEYHLTATTPALCLPVGVADTTREEL